MPQNAITVSQLNRYIKAVLSEDVHLKSICLKGEISNFTDHKKTGHFYFTLKDTTSAVRAVMFRGYASKVRFIPENGMNVIVTGSVQVLSGMEPIKFTVKQWNRMASALCILLLNS